MSYKVKIDIFEGPFDLLVYLIENAQMSIYDIQISQITDEYLRYLEGMKELDVTVGSEFMVLAAALIEIKSKMLLPRTTESGEVIVDEDPRAELVTKLLEYKRFKQISQMLQEAAEESALIYEKPREDMSEYVNSPDEYLNLSLEQFVSAFDLFLHKKKKVEEVRKHYVRVERERESTETRMRFIHSLLRKSKGSSVSFSEVIKDSENKYDVVLSFTSVLELIKKKMITAEQKMLYGDITISELNRGESR